MYGWGIPRKKKGVTQKGGLELQLIQHLEGIVSLWKNNWKQFKDSKDRDKGQLVKFVMWILLVASPGLHGLTLSPGD